MHQRNKSSYRRKLTAAPGSIFRAVMRYVFPAMKFAWAWFLWLISPFLIGALATPMTSLRRAGIVILSFFVFTFPLFWLADLIARGGWPFTALLILLLTPVTLLAIGMFVQTAYSGRVEIRLEPDEPVQFPAEEEVDISRSPLSGRDKSARTQDSGIASTRPTIGYSITGMLARLFLFALLLATGYFALVTVLFDQLHLFYISSGHPQSQWLVSSFRNYYLWHAADAIPVLSARGRSTGKCHSLSTATLPDRCCSRTRSFCLCRSSRLRQWCWMGDSKDNSKKSRRADFRRQGQCCCWKLMPARRQLAHS